MKTIRLALLPAGLLALPTLASAQGMPPREAPDNRAALEKMLAERFDAMDANRDGKITGDERQAMRARHEGEMFKRADANADGKLDEAEFRAMHQGHMAGMAQRGKRAKARAERREARMAQVQTRDQFMARGLAMFDRVDANRDGVISPAERDAMRGKLRGRMAPPPAI